MPFHIIRGNIVDMQTDAIVNAANAELRAGGGVCGTIYAAAGFAELQAACAVIGGCAVGGAVITPGFRLPAKYVIHAVGPMWQGGDHAEGALLAAAYRSALSLAAGHGLRSIAFPLISSGVYGYPKAQALSVAVSAIGSFLLTHGELDVYLVIYDHGADTFSDGRYSAIEGYIDAHQSASTPVTVLPNEEDCFLPDSESTVGTGNPPWHSAFEPPLPSAAEPPPTTSAPMPPNAPTFPAFLRRIARDSQLQAAPTPERAIPPEEPHAAHPASPMDENSSPSKAGNPPKTLTGFARTTIFSAAREESLDEAIAHLGDTFSESVLHLVDRSGRTDVEVYKRANLDRKLFSKLRSDPDYRPSKSTAVALCIALELSLADARDLMARAGYALSMSSKADLIVAFFIEHGNYDIFELNEALFTFDQPCLGA